MIDAPLAYAMTLGMVATVNPCGFAMLPAYLSFFVGVEEQVADDRGGATGGVTRALVVGLAVTAGFTVTFGLLGFVIVHLTREVYEISPWISVVIGVALVVVGLALLIGWEPRVRLPRLDRGGRSRGVLSMALFGVSYAVASLGCTMPLFLPGLAATFRDANLVSGIAWFVAYSVGMGLVLTALAITLALARHSLVRSLRRVLPYVNRVAGALLVVAGAYVAYFGTLEIRLGQGGRGNSVAERVWGWSGEVQAWVQDVGPTRLALLLAAVVAVAAVFSWGRRLAGRRW